MSYPTSLAPPARQAVNATTSRRNPARIAFGAGARPGPPSSAPPELRLTLDKRHAPLRSAQRFVPSCWTKPRQGYLGGWVARGASSAVPALEHPRTSAPFATLAPAARSFPGLRSCQGDAAWSTVHSGPGAVSSVETGDVLAVEPLGAGQGVRCRDELGAGSRCPSRWPPAGCLGGERPNAGKGSWGVVARAVSPGARRRRSRFGP